MRKIKKYVPILLACLLSVAMLGCGQARPSTQPNKGMSGTENKPVSGTENKSVGSNSPEMKTLTLKTSIQSPPKAALSKGFDAFLDEVETKSKGRIKFERFYSESLAKAADQFNALSTGIADVSMFVPTYTPGKLPLANVSSNPALWEDSWVGSKAFNDLYQSIPEMQQELEKNQVKFVGQYATPAYYPITTKPVHKIDDLKGLKVIATGQLGVLAKELGAVPVGIPITDSFEAMQRKTIDGVFYGVTAATTYGLEQSAKYIWKLPVGGSAGIIGMNLNTWKKLPKDIQDIIIDVGSNSHPSAFHKIYQIEGDDAAFKKFQDAGATITQPTTDDLNQLKEIAKSATWSKWIQDVNAKGLPGQKVFDTFVEKVAKYEKENPFKSGK